MRPIHYISEISNYLPNEIRGNIIIETFLYTSENYLNVVSSTTKNAQKIVINKDYKPNKSSWWAIINEPFMISDMWHKLHLNVFVSLYGHNNSVFYTLVICIP